MAEQCSPLPCVEPQPDVGRPRLASTHLRRMLCGVAFLAFFGVGDLTPFKGLYAQASATLPALGAVPTRNGAFRDSARVLAHHSRRLR